MKKERVHNSLVCPQCKISLHYDNVKFVFQNKLKCVCGGRGWKRSWSESDKRKVWPKQTRHLDKRHLSFIEESQSRSTETLLQFEKQETGTHCQVKSNSKTTNDFKNKLDNFWRKTGINKFETKNWKGIQHELIERDEKSPIWSEWTELNLSRKPWNRNFTMMHTVVINLDIPVNLKKKLWNLPTNLPQCIDQSMEQ